MQIKMRLPGYQIAFSKRIQATLRPADMVARLGGDEFAVLVEDMQSSTSVLDLAKRLQETFLEPFRTNDTDTTSSASIGICYSATRLDTPDDVIRDADLAMYKAKATGKAQHAVFDLSLHDRATADLQLENELRRAIAVGELRLHYQPQHRFGDRGLYGYEALIRWAHQKRGLLYLAPFLGVAQETVLIFPLGRRVITEACAQMKRWRKKRSRAWHRAGIADAREHLQPRIQLAEVCTVRYRYIGRCRAACRMPDHRVD